MGDPNNRKRGANSPIWPRAKASQCISFDTARTRGFAKFMADRNNFYAAEWLSLRA